VTLFVRQVVQSRPSAAGASEDLLWMFKVHSAIAAFCLAGAMLTLRRQYRFETSGGRRGRWRTPRIRLTPRFRIGVLPAMLWKEFRFAPATGFFFTIVVGVISLAYPAHLIYLAVVDKSLAWDPFTRSYLDAMRIAGMILAQWTCLIVLFRAATAVSTERSQDTWVSLLTTQLSARAILFGKVAGVLRPLLLLLLLVSPFWIAGAFFGAVNSWTIGIPLGAAAVFAFFFACVGVTQSLARKTPGGAIGSSFFVFILVNGLGQLLFGLLGVILVLAFRSLPHESENVLFYLFLESIPGVLMAGSAWREANDWASGEYAAVICFIGAFWLLAYSLAGWLLVELAARNFSETTGRSDHPYANPGPPPKRAVGVPALADPAPAA
jgi:hypothetical protein